MRCGWRRRHAGGGGVPPDWHVGGHVLRGRKYAELGVSELRKLRQLEDENARLRRIVADLTLDKQILQEVVKKSSEGCQAPRAAAWMQERFKVSVHRSWRLALLQRSSWYAKSEARDQVRCASASGTSR